MTNKTDPAVAEYLARTKTALAGLPASEVEEIIDDIGPHLSEIAGELDEVTVDALSERLGTPEQYAAELRAAAGYPAGGPEPAASSTALPRLTLWGLTAGVFAAFVLGLAGSFGRYPPVPMAVFAVFALLGVALLLSGTVRVGDLADLPEAEAARQSGRRFVAALPARLVGFFLSLRPAWGVLRTLVLGAALLLGLARVEPAQMFLVVAALVVTLGFRSRTDQRLRWGVAAANAFAIGYTLVLTAWLVSVIPYRNDVYLVDSSPNVPQQRNVYVFEPDGRPLSEVYLYDQDGNPINVLKMSCDEIYGDVTNKVPQPIVERLDTGECVERTGPPFTVVIPHASTPPSASAPPATSLSAPTSK
jgi:hypothetical protein